MELIIGVIMVILSIGALFYICKNLTVNININYPEVKFETMEQPDYDNENVMKDIVDFDEMLKDIHDLMLDKEDEVDE